MRGVGELVPFGGTAFAYLQRGQRRVCWKFQDLKVGALQFMGWDLVASAAIRWPYLISLRFQQPVFGIFSESNRKLRLLNRLFWLLKRNNGWLLYGSNHFDWFLNSLDDGLLCVFYDSQVTFFVHQAISSFKSLKEIGSFWRYGRTHFFPRETAVGRFWWI